MDFVRWIRYFFIFFQLFPKSDQSQQKEKWFLTGPFTILVSQDQEVDEVYLDLKRRATDFEASKLRKGRSGFVIPRPSTP